MKISKEFSTDTHTLAVTVEDTPWPGETMVGFENRMVETVEKAMGPRVEIEDE